MPSPRQRHDIKSRRAVRPLMTGALVLVALSFAGPVAAQTTCAPGSQQLIVYHAGSLTAAFSQVEKLFTQQTGVCVIDVSATIAAPGGVFNPPASVPDAAADWYAQLMRPGVTVGGSHPFLDPSGYRADMIFQLSEDHYRVPNLYDSLLAHYTLARSTDHLGTTYDYQIIYEHSALAAYNTDATKSYRFVKLPEDIGLGNSELNHHYRRAGVIVPGLHVPGAAVSVRIPATRVAWGLTILKDAPNQENAVSFLQLLFGPQGVAAQTTTGPAPISPPVVSTDDYAELPASLRSIVSKDRPDQ